jgi:glutamine amidotransferase
MKCGLIDYGRGNLRSVAKALESNGAEVRLIESGETIGNPDILVLPGVGAFGDAMTNLQERKLVEPIREWLEADRPFLGICLGYQLLFNRSEESPEIAGFGFVEGEVVKFPPEVGKIPHMGWNAVEPGPAASGVADCLGPEHYYYHVHSYYPTNVQEAIVACRTDYGGTFASGIRKGKVMAFQFHPEKSQQQGLALLRACLATLG